MAAAKIPLPNFIGRMILAIAGITFMGLVTLIVVQLWLGKLDQDDLAEILFVLRGDKRYAMSVSDINEYRKLLKEKEEEEAQATLEEGAADTRAASAAAARQALEIQRENYDVLKAELAKEQEKLRELNTRYAQLKKEVEDARKLHTSVRKQDEMVDMAKQSEELMRTLQNMDAGDIGAFLEAFMGENSPDVAADYLRRYTRPDFRAEVLTEMTPAGREKILPLLANKYAGLTPDQVLQRWRSEENLTPEQMQLRLLQMPVSQAFGVYLKMNAPVRAKLAPFLLSP